MYLFSPLLIILSIPLWSDFITERNQFRILHSLLPFNPTMVWFYPWTPPLYAEAYGCFQSHYGLILSSSVHNDRRKRDSTFNPTMVWFYQKTKIVPLITLHSFNPTMVWFYLCENFLKKFFRLYGFQSHYGLILSCNYDVATLHYLPTLLSIPLWSDFIKVC